MLKLQIFDIKDYEYYLKDENGTTYNLNLEFYNTLKPQIHSYIYASKKLLNERMLAFGPLDNTKDTNIKEEDIIKIVTDDNEIYLQRYYG